MQLSTDAARPDGHAWMFDLLYGGEPSVAWGAAGTLPDGYERVEQFALLPSGSDRSFAVSLASRLGSASALTSYNALRTGRKRTARRAMGIGLRLSLAQPFLRNRVDVGVRPNAAAEQLGANLITDHLQHVLGQGPVVLAITGGEGPYRKPVLQAFSTLGIPLGYVKVGWNEWTRAGVRREAEALRACASRPMHIGVPALLDLSSWRGLDLLVTAPLPLKVRGLAAAASLPDATVLREINGLSPGHFGPLAASSWWHSVRARITANVEEPVARLALERAAGQLERGLGHVPLEFGFCHGDLVPWNLARVRERLYAWDWESSARDAPVGFDALHFHFQVAFIARGLPLAEATALAAHSARATLAELGVPTGSCPMIATLHLIELFLRHEEARASARDADARFYPAILGVLDQQLASALAPAAKADARVA